MKAESTKFDALVGSGLLEIGDGYRAKNAELGGNGPIFLRAAYLQDEGFILENPDRFNEQAPKTFGPKVAELDDVVITTKGNSTGRVGRIRQQQIGSIYSPHLSYWRSKDRSKVDQIFLFYWSRGIEFKTQLAGMAASTDMAPYLSLRDQLRLDITLPDIVDQRAIGTILGALDDKIDLNHRTNDTLEATARAIYKDWFVDFGPTRAKMDARKPYLEPDIWALFPDRLNNEGTPEGWHASSIGSLATISGGKQLHASQISSQSEVPVFGGAGPMGFTKDYNVDGWVITFGRVGVYCGQFFWHRGKAWINNNASLVTPHSERDAPWLFLCMSGLDLEPIKKGAAQPFVSNGDMAALQCTVPPESIRKIFHSLIKPMFDRLDLNKREANTLVATRDLLLPKLMSGEICVKEAEKIAEAVA